MSKMQPIQQTNIDIYKIQPNLKDNKHNSFHLNVKICWDNHIRLWTLSVPHSSQFSLSFALGKLFASRNR